MNKKKILIIVLAIIAITISSGLYYILTKEDKTTSLTLFEKQWIENNKNNVIDMSIVSDIPVLSYGGEGIIVDFLDSLNKETGLSFNKVSYKLNSDINTEYAFKITDEVKDDILIYEDNYVILTKDKTYLDLSSLNGLKIGVLNEDLDKTNKYLYKASVTYKTFSSVEEMINEFNSNETNLTGIVLLKTVYLKDIINNNYKIAYNISDYKKYLVLTLGNLEKLNTILTKYYSKWSNENYDQLYNKYLSKNYFNIKNINDSTSVKFRSKRYVYGFIENGAYDTVLSNKLAGINNQTLSMFSSFTNAEISYKKYNNIEELLNAFNQNQIDLFYAINSDTNYNIDITNTIPSYINNIVVLKHLDNDTNITSIMSLSKASTIKQTKISYYLESNGINVKEYNNLEELINNFKKDEIIVMDLNNYMYYASKLNNFVICDQFNISNNSFIIRNISDNKMFSELFDFYLSFNDSKISVNNGLKEIMIIDKTPIILKQIAIILGSIVLVLLAILSIIKIKPKKKNNLTKEDKLRYIDALTSLKNRNYLNSSIEKWDNSEIYPQAIIIIDLNNIAYINDNYGHAEGDYVIKQAANILIQNQLSNSEIIRTNGNEFLIYAADCQEKQVVTYIRKLNKELKELKHGFGAEYGYSMINDGIKTIDDAINEATLDMRNNKEKNE